MLSRCINLQPSLSTHSGTAFYILQACRAQINSYEAMVLADHPLNYKLLKNCHMIMTLFITSITEKKHVTPPAKTRISFS